MFNGNIVMLPERAGNRMMADVVTTKTEKIGWRAEISVKDCIRS